MSHPIPRRLFLLSAALLPFASLAAPAIADRRASAAARLAALEADFGGRLGVCALDTASGAELGHRAGERFPFCSTFKAMLVGAVLARSAKQPGLLAERIHYARRDLVEYSPRTEPHLADGMTVAELCAAAVQYSDNSAANFLLKLLGGPAALTAYMRSIGDESFLLERWEPELNRAVPGEARDTSTPQAMAQSLRRLALGDALAPHAQRQLVEWLRGNTTGAEKIRAGVPAGWVVGDKTGNGRYGSSNDIAVLWPPGRAPAVLTVFTTQALEDAKQRHQVVAAAARIAADWLA
ncbi:class A beta-lactamase [Chromobacterium subtsugae]|uniref:class A beta-lactamase n=1 Tax=Chromobacterium subtsugae TaxID=251747 RepID=UPI0006416144|nr:class A beta-lactamase [Chromobacterium subtsugae]OBU86255.1 beta-lactamase [Chromobacterium subtsugae]